MDEQLDSSFYIDTYLACPSLSYLDTSLLYYLMCDKCGMESFNCVGRWVGII